MLDQHALLDFYSARSLKQQCLSTRTHYPDSEQTNICSFSVMPHAYRRSNIYQFHSLSLTRPRLVSMLYGTRGENANHYIIDAIHCCLTPTRISEVTILHEMIDCWLLNVQQQLFHVYESVR